MCVCVHPYRHDRSSCVLFIIIHVLMFVTTLMHAYTFPHHTPMNTWYHSNTVLICTYVWPYLTVLIHMCIIVLGNTVNRERFAGLHFRVFTVFKNTAKVADLSFASL